MSNQNTLKARRINRVKTSANPVVSQNLARNMELVIVGAKTVYRPINPYVRSSPVRTEKLNHIRRSWGRPEKTEKKNIPLVVHRVGQTVVFVSFGGEMEVPEAV